MVVLVLVLIAAAVIVIMSKKLSSRDTAKVVVKTSGLQNYTQLKIGKGNVSQRRKMGRIDDAGYKRPTLEPSGRAEKIARNYSPSKTRPQETYNTYYNKQ